jgi:hypothetical protein
VTEKITGLPPVPPNDLRKLLEQIKRGFAEQVELSQLVAKLDREKFKAYVAAGFSEAQALELLKAEKIRAHV